VTPVVPQFSAGDKLSPEQLERRGDEIRTWAAAVGIAKTRSGARCDGNIEVRAWAPPNALASQAK
jgi:hypothetical protein